MNPDVLSALRAAERGDAQRVRDLLACLDDASDEYVAVAVVAYLAGILPLRPALPDRPGEAALWVGWLAIVERVTPRG